MTGFLRPFPEHQKKKFGLRGPGLPKKQTARRKGGLSGISNSPAAGVPPGQFYQLSFGLNRLGLNWLNVNVRFVVSCFTENDLSISKSEQRMVTT
jgi:hypothetical protein